MTQEDAISRIRIISTDMVHCEFEAKPVYIYDIHLSYKEYTEMLLSEKKILRNWILQIWQYILYFLILTYKSAIISLEMIILMIIYAFITTEPVKATNFNEIILTIRTLIIPLSVLSCCILLFLNPNLRHPKNIFRNEVIKKLYKKAQENNNR
ncbi:hypothetical protein OQ257_08570 [Actinobacillus equuli subsp. equuli]|uniref:Uncharacterized protein n=1 Tax=Actinobacillus equuli subsp. equuli TaxID=202947 RepID=A0A9X4JCQ2_ACTEU|nr:hypothetical protein [Actinobacillus equuli]MDE8035216.1 hypothetical protein [Actinobacillus equuli subsp. equuli]